MIIRNGNTAGRHRSQHKLQPLYGRDDLRGFGGTANRSMLTTQRDRAHQGKKTFKEVWRKAVEKYSPKKAEKLNEVSCRFQTKLNELDKNRKATLDLSNESNFKVTSTIPRGRIGDDDEEGKVKFVSMIDQKPIKPSYLELVPYKDFTRKE